MIFSKKHSILPILLLLTFTSCLEEFDFKTEDFESALVIEATITNENKQQEIVLSRTFRFEEDGPNPEIGADVSVSASNGTIYNFTETTPGRYQSTSNFSAIAGLDYQLNITTSDGRNYSSNPTQLTAVTTIDTITPTRQINEAGEEEVAILLDSFDPNGASKYYRYEYEETYKIIAPFWSGMDAVITDDGQVTTVPRTQEERICYNTVKSNNIIITDTNDLTEDRVSNFPVRTINRDNYIISHRYSIQVRQYVQSLSSYTYYSTLRDLSGSESIFSENQPGFFNGNVFSITNNNERVIGFFDVSSVVEQRIYFNYLDLFPGEDLPPYAENCILQTPELYFYDGPGSPLIDAIISDTLTFVSVANEDTGFGFAPYVMVFAPCGDCTRLGSNVVPDFWVD